MPTVAERVNIIERALATYMAESARVLATIHEEIAEIRLSNARTDRQLLALQHQADKDREQGGKDREKAEKDRKDFNKRLAEMSDAQGLLIENMVWPNLPNIASEVFGEGNLVHRAIRIKRSHPNDRSQSMELDLMAVSENEIIICEAKTKVTIDKIKEFIESLARFNEFFPEYADHKLYPMVASIFIDPGVIKFMTRKGVLALGFGDETMDLLNPEAVGA